MRTILKSVIAFTLGAGIFFAAQASADRRPDYCAIDHDHRSHSASYYKYYDADRYYRAGPYRANRRSDRYNDYDDYDRYDRRGRRDRYDRRGRQGRYGRHRARSRVVHRENFSTRYRARITLVEEVYYTRSGREQLVCSVVVKGPEADYVPNRRLRRIARRGCSQYARVQYL